MKMKRSSMLCALALTLALLSGCMPAVVMTSPWDEGFQEDWEESMEELEDGWEEWKDAWDRREEDRGGKDHHWKILDVSDGEPAATEAGTVTDEERIEALDDLLGDDGSWKIRTSGDPGGPACSYVYCQQETLKAGQEPEDREYEDLMRFTVSESEDVVTVTILEDLPSVLGVDLGDLLTFTFDVPAETAEALRDPAPFMESK